MKDIFDRPLKAGDFVVNADRNLITKSYGLVLSDKYILNLNGRRVGCSNCYLVENPCDGEKEIYKNLLSIFSNYQKKVQKQLIENQKKEKEKRERLKGFHYIPGDILKLSSNSIYDTYLYLGYFKIDDLDNLETKEGHLYLRIYDLNQIDDFVMPFNNKLNIGEVMYHTLNPYKFKNCKMDLLNYDNYEIIFTKGLSSRFYKVAGHYDLFLSDNEENELILDYLRYRVKLKMLNKDS